MAGAWCLATFVLVQAYTSLLTTYIIAPSNTPLIESVYDIVKSSDIELVVNIGSYLDDIILVAYYNNFFFYPKTSQNITVAIEDDKIENLLLCCTL